MDPAHQVDETELEIAAFQGPHIKRARIVLVAVGILYCIVGYTNYDDVKQLKEMIAEVGSDNLKTSVNIAYAAIVFLMIAGVANVVLAIVAGQHAVGAMYIAMGIFVVHTCFQLYLGGGMIFSNLFWWLTAICIGMGFQAALKTQKLRKERRGGL